MDLGKLLLKNILPFGRKHDEDISSKEKSLRDIFEYLVQKIPNNSSIKKVAELIDEAYTKSGEERYFGLIKTYFFLEDLVLEDFSSKNKNISKEEIRTDIYKKFDLKSLNKEIKLVFLPERQRMIVLYELFLSFLGKYLISNVGSERILKIIKSQNTQPLLKEISIFDNNFVFDSFNKKLDFSLNIQNKNITEIFSFIVKLFLIEISSVFGSNSDELIVKKYFDKIKENYDYDIISTILEIIPEEMLDEERLAFLSREELENKVKERTLLLKREKEIVDQKVKERTKELESEKLKLSVITENMLEGAILLDNLNKVIYINSQAEKILGIEKNKGDSQTFFDSFLKKFIDIKIKDCLSRAHSDSFFEIPEVDSQNKIYKLIFTSVNDGGVEKFLVWIEDITQSKILERRKTEFVSVVAHQLRTPLSAIKWSLNMILNDKTNSIAKESRELIDSAYKSNDRMILLVNDMLNVNKISAGSYEYNFIKISFTDLMDSIMSELLFEAKTKNISLIYKERPNHNVEIEADPEKIRIATQNLIENAIRYTPHDGKIDVLVYDLNDIIKVEVQDFGIGIPESEKENIFVRFFRGEKAVRSYTDGSGLGLFISKNIIEAHGGKIGFESTEGKGSTFYFEIPKLKNKIV